MFKNSFLSGLLAGTGALIACVVYSSFYFNNLVDFSEVVTISRMAGGCFAFGMTAAFLRFGMEKVIKKDMLAVFSTNILLSLLSIGAVFYVLKMDDPQFMNEDAQLFIDYYKGFIMPMLFFPALAWFTFTPLIFRKNG